MRKIERLKLSAKSTRFLKEKRQDEVDAGRAAQAQELRGQLLSEPFRSMLDWLLVLWREEVQQNVRLLPDRRARLALDDCGAEIESWLNVGQEA